ncbi:hypothetical protein DYY65_06905 [Nitrososphaera sp. AFS]|nr:hypothetical protein [Nitrososphaera sp. AFS]
MIAIVAAMGLLLSIIALKKPFSLNSSAQVSNSGSTNAGISKASGISYGTGRLSYESEGNRLSVKLEDRLLAYIAAAATIAGGVLHLMMIGPLLKPANFPMQLLLYTDILFIVAGLAQIFWALPMIKGWGLRWYYVGILGTAALSISLIFTRLPNEITSSALVDTNPMALLTEISQFLYIGATTIIARRAYLRQKEKMRSVRLDRGN